MARGHKWTTLLAGLAASGAWACERMEPSGDVLAPVKVEASVGAASTEPAIEEVDPDFAVAEPLRISSEELRGNASPEDHGAADGSDHEATPPGEDGDAAAALDLADDDAAAAADAVVTASPAPATHAAVPVPTATSSAFGTQWPVRLVSTTPSAQPPMAILGFANGDTVAVFPGTMVPDHNIVVMAIGQNSVEVARIAPNGDHALVSQTTLTALN